MTVPANFEFAERLINDGYRLRFNGQSPDIFEGIFHTVSSANDAEGYYVASVPQIRGCHTQARSLDEAAERIREAISLCLEVDETPPQELEFVGIQRVTVAA